MAVMVRPEKYRRRLRTTNMMERLNEEIRRRERVIRVFPNEASVICFIGALLAEVSETWKERVYLRGGRRLGAGRGPKSTHERERESGVTARSTRTDFTATLGRDVATSSAAFTAL